MQGYVVVFKLWWVHVSILQPVRCGVWKHWVYFHKSTITIAKGLPDLSCHLVGAHTTAFRWKKTPSEQLPFLQTAGNTTCVTSKHYSPSVLIICTRIPDNRYNGHLKQKQNQNAGKNKKNKETKNTPDINKQNKKTQTTNKNKEPYTTKHTHTQQTAKNKKQTLAPQTETGTKHRKRKTKKQKTTNKTRKTQTNTGTTQQ